MRKNKLIRVAIPAIGILFGLVLYQYVYLGIQGEIAGIKEQQAVKKRTLQIYMATIAERPELEKKMAALKETVKANRTKLLEGEPISLASATLQDTVKGVVTGRGGTISSERINKPEDAVKPTPNAAGQAAGNAGKEVIKVKGTTAPSDKKKKAEPGSRFKVITISLDSTVPDTAALSDILYSIETRTPYLMVKELDARVKNFKNPRELMVRFDVTGLYGGK